MPPLMSQRPEDRRTRLFIFRQWRTKRELTSIFTTSAASPGALRTCRLVHGRRFAVAGTSPEQVVSSILTLPRCRFRGRCLTVTGNTLAENHADVVVEPDQDLFYAPSRPIKSTGTLATVVGNLAPEGAICKTAGLKETKFVGRAKVFESERACLAAVLARKYEAGDVLIIRYEGPKGSPGMPELLDDLGDIRTGYG